jgi:trehalose-6-phosphatase
MTGHCLQVQSVDGEPHEALPLTLESGLVTMMSEVRQHAEHAIADIPGATVEDNTYSVSVHFRNCSPSDWPRVRLPVRLLSNAGPRACLWHCTPPRACCMH